MDILPITVYGDKILREKAKPVEEVDGAVIRLIQNMYTTMRNAQGIGLAANQVASDKKIFVLDLSPMEGYEDFKPLVMINPEIIDESEEQVVIEEGCLSLPDLRADVERAEKIKVRFLNTDEKEVELEADGMFARVILHEYDHLMGKMIPDRVTPELRKKLQPLLKKIMNREIEADYPLTDK